VGRSLDHLIGELIDAGSREHYEDAELYDHEYRRRRADVGFYRQLARRLLGPTGPATAEPERSGRSAAVPSSRSGLPPSILELGAGTGRLTLPLARDGYRVTAVDVSRPMLDRLRARVARAPAAIRDRIAVHMGDLRDFTIPGGPSGGPKFPLVIAAFNVVEHLYTRVELAAFLAAVRRHLAPGGRLAFDVQMPDLAWLLRDPTRRWARTRFTHPRTGERLYYSTNHDYDPVSQIALIRIYYDPADPVRSDDDPARARVVQLSQRKYFPAELEALLAAGGFAVVERWGDFAGQPLGPAAESQVILARLSTEIRPR
jgi:SAM-dependent methyltransferase